MLYVPQVIIMSIDITNVRENLASKQGKAYWRSLDELADTQEFRHFMSQEFPNHVAPLESSLNRRDFMKLLGASLALAGLTSCARPVKPYEKIVPYVKAPEEIIPGKPLFFATNMTQGGYAVGLLAESHQGRPTKVEGNPDHPASLGATDTSTQATVLSLYDPDRSQETLKQGQSQNWTDFVEDLQAKFTDLANGEGLYILTENVTSPTLAQQLNELATEFPATKWHQFDTMHGDNAFAGSQLAFGEFVHTHYDLSKADVILSLGADFLGEGANKVRYSKDFARRRKVLGLEDDMNRLYLVETSPGISSPVADHKLALSPSKIAAFATTVAHDLGLDAEALDTDHADFIHALVEDLEAHKGSSVVIAGEEQAPEVHALAHAMNVALGNVGSTVIYSEAVDANPMHHGESIKGLVDAMNAEEVKVLLMVGGNPVYNAPADLNFAGALAKVPFSAHLSLYQDETSTLSTWHIPQTHYLETWSDARSFDGSISIAQPLIAPFYGGKSAHEFLAAILGDAEASGYDLVRNYWKAQVTGDFNGFWQKVVYKGVIEDSHAAPKAVSLQALPKIELENGGLELSFKFDPNILDGSLANNGWLQEIPKPITKIVWDNAAYVSLKDAERLDLKNHQLINLSANGKSITAPVWVLPGQAEGAITVTLGFGRTSAGRIADGVGFNAYPLRSTDAMWTTAVTLTKASGRHKLITTQVHHEYEGTTERRHIVRHGTLAEFKEALEHDSSHAPHFVHPVEHHESDLYEVPYFNTSDYQWGMVIDMSVCTGCNACVTACQSENNIPIVGKDQVEVGREMHWIRVDTYYGGNPDNPEFYMQPINCMHCEQAPCEPVCPVGATVHDNEGLNVMVYNRCVGTRYCSNNCPYKVRRYNFLQFAELSTNATELSLAQNPDVTVRSRGVMEKCSYCVQRIQQSYITSENEGRAIFDGEVVTACQGACPMEAITFGNINDGESKVTKAKNSKLNYSLLEELNTKPRTTFLAKLTNPHPALAGEESGAH